MKWVTAPEQGFPNDLPGPDSAWPLDLRVKVFFGRQVGRFQHSGGSLAGTALWSSRRSCQSSRYYARAPWLLSTFKLEMNGRTAPGILQGGSRAAFDLSDGKSKEALGWASSAVSA